MWITATCIVHKSLSSSVAFLSWSPLPIVWNTSLWLLRTKPVLDGATIQSTTDGDVRQYGMAKEGLITRQFMLGVVQTADGLPIYHEVFDGNTAEAKTLLPTLKKVMQRFPSLRRLVLPSSTV